MSLSESLKVSEVVTLCRLLQEKNLSHIKYWRKKLIIEVKLWHQVFFKQWNIWVTLLIAWHCTLRNKKSIWNFSRQSWCHFFRMLKTMIGKLTLKFACWKFFLITLQTLIIRAVQFLITKKSKMSVTGINRLKAPLKDTIVDNRF